MQFPALYTLMALIFKTVVIVSVIVCYESVHFALYDL